MNDKINSINKEIEQEKKLHDDNKTNIKFHNDSEKKRHNMRMNFLKDKKKKARQNNKYTNDNSYKNYVSDTMRLNEALECEIEKAMLK